RQYSGYWPISQKHGAFEKMFGAEHPQKQLTPEPHQEHDQIRAKFKILRAESGFRIRGVEHRHNQGSNTRNLDEADDYLTPVAQNQRIIKVAVVHAQNKHDGDERDVGEPA